MKRLVLPLLLFLLQAHSVDIDLKLERAKEWIKRGFWFYNNGDFKEAITCYKKALHLKEDLPDGWYWYGNALFRYGMLDLSKVSYERYLKLCDDPYIKDKLRTWGKGEDTYKHIFTIKGDIADPLRFFLPCGISIDRFNNLYIAGFGNDVIIKLSPFGKGILKIQDKALKNPFGVCVDKDGNIYATSFANNCVLKFSPSGKPILKFGKRGIKDGEFMGPKGIEVDDFGYIYVVDATRMQKFSKKGSFIGKIDNLTSANNLCFDNKYIFITENSSIKKFSSSFNYISSCKIKGKWVSIYKNNLYIATDDGIFIYSKDLKPIEKIKCPFKPHTLSFNKFGFLYATSQEVSEIHAFSDASNSLDFIVNRIDLVNYPLVLFSLTIKANGHNVSGLSGDNFRILEENRAVYPLGVDEVFKKREALGFVFVIEDSKYINKEGINELLFPLIKQFKDGFVGASIVSFSKKAKVLSHFTLNKTNLREAIESLSFKDNITEDAFIYSLNKGITSAIPLLSKKAVIVITSFKFKKETNEIERLINYARNNGVPIFIIDYKRDKDPILEKISLSSGGKYLLSRNSKELNELYIFLKRELSCQTQYILYYHSPNAALKWRDEWTFAEVEVGKEKFQGRCKVPYLIPHFGGASSSLGKTLIENKLYALQAEKIKIMEKKKERIRKEIKEALKAKEEKEKVKEEKEGKKMEEEKKKGD